jgi:hypothetical protein
MVHLFGEELQVRLLVLLQLITKMTHSYFRPALIRVYFETCEMILQCISRNFGEFCTILEPSTIQCAGHLAGIG